MIIREMILFSLLCLGALFFNSSEFVDTGIVPKWYMTITMGILLVAYYLILSQRKRPFSFEMQGIIYAIIISCALQALYGILQYWGVLQCTSLIIRQGLPLLYVPVYLFCGLYGMG